MGGCGFYNFSVNGRRFSRDEVIFRRYRHCRTLLRSDLALNSLRFNASLEPLHRFVQLRQGVFQRVQTVLYIREVLLRLFSILACA